MVHQKYRITYSTKYFSSFFPDKDRKAREWTEGNIIAKHCLHLFYTFVPPVIMI